MNLNGCDLEKSVRHIVTPEILHFLHFLQLLSSVTDSFLAERTTNHLHNNSFYEFVPSCREHAVVSWVGIAVGDSLMWAERLPCWLSTRSQARLQGPQRLWREAYHQYPCCLITFFLSSFLPLTSQAAIRICTLSPHHHLFIHPFSSVVFLSALRIFSYFWEKGPKWHQRRSYKQTKYHIHFQPQRVYGQTGTHLHSCILSSFCYPPLHSFIHPSKSDRREVSAVLSLIKSYLIIQLTCFKLHIL